MSWYIGTREEVEAYNQKVDAIQNYSGSITNNWSMLLEHPDGTKWAVVANTIQPDEGSGLTLVEELPPDWNPTEE